MYSANTVMINIPVAVLSQTERLKHNIKAAAVAADSGIADEAHSALAAIKKLPSLAGMNPADVREMRKLRGNPYDHLDIALVNREDILIPLKSESIQARIYRPMLADTTELPALVYFHGGGFVLGDIPAYDNLLASMCEQSGVAIVSVAYRLAPEVPFPGAVDDAIASYQWLRENAKDFKLVAEKLAIGGDSAGGNLAIASCMHFAQQQMPMPAFQLLIYPCTLGNNSSPSRKLFSDAHILSETTLNWFHNHYIDRSEDQDHRFCVFNAEYYSQLPPAYVLTAGFDPLRDEGLAFVEKLRQHGVSASHSCYTDMFHGFINFGVLHRSQVAIRECAKVLAETFFEKT